VRNRAFFKVLQTVILWPLVLWGCPMEEKLIFFPDTTVERTPRHLGLDFEDVFFDTSDGLRLNGWFVPRRDASRTLVWFHGNAGNISHRLENIRLLHDKVKINIFIFDYRGYGRSEGKVSEEGTYLDGKAAVGWLRAHRDVDEKSLVLFGRSLGAAVAAEIAAGMGYAALILESPFASIREMARASLPLLPIGPLLSTRYDVVEKVRKIKSPLLVLHGDRDEIVPFAQGRMVFDAAPHPKQFYTIKGAGHNDTYRVGADLYFQTLQNFIEQTTGISMQ
jgi:uncharacterized protein